eukprot:7282730-Pyramimonas_sp.AAC.1
MRLKAIIADPTPYTENKRYRTHIEVIWFSVALARSSRPALEGPAKPSTAENGLPVGMRLTGPNEGNALANLRPPYGY